MTKRTHPSDSKCLKRRSIGPCRAGWVVAAVLVSLLVASTVLAEGTSTPHLDALAMNPELDRGLLGQGRQAYRERADDARARDAYRLFKQNLEQNPDDPVAAWHLSMSCYYLGHRVYKDPEARKRVHGEGRAAADRGLAKDPNCAPCHLLSAINHALWAEQVGIFRSLVGLPTVRDHLDRAAELDPAFAGAAAHRTLAQIASALPRMFGGGKDKVVFHVKNALRVAPQEPLNYEVMVDLMIQDDDFPGALHWARQGIAVPPPAPEYVESVDSVEYMEQIVDLLSRVLKVAKAE